MADEVSLMHPECMGFSSSILQLCSIIHNRMLHIFDVFNGKIVLKSLFNSQSIFLREQNWTILPEILQCIPVQVNFQWNFNEMFDMEIMPKQKKPSIYVLHKC